MNDKDRESTGDAQLSDIDPDSAKKKFDAGIPVTLKELAAAFRLSYAVPRQWKHEGLPLISRKVSKQ